MRENRRTDAGALRRRIRILQIGLAVPLLVTIMLAVSYHSALRSQRRAVEAAGQLLVRRVAEAVLREADVQGTQAARTVLEPVGRAATSTPAALLSAMQRAADSLRACRCGPIKEGAYLFAWSPTTGRFASSVPIAAEMDPRRRLGPNPMAQLPRSDNISAPTGVDGTGPWLMHVTSRVTEGVVTIAGFDIAMDSWWRDTFLPAVLRSARASFAMVPDPDSAIGVELTHRGRVLGQHRAGFTGPSAVVPVLPTSGFSLVVTLNPATLPLLLATTPPSHALVITSLVLSIMAAIAGVVLLRQVRRTIVMREAFVASVSHELRTPLTEVLLHAETLQLDRNTPEAKGRAVDSIVRETRRLIGLIENALTAAGAGRPARTPTTRPLAPTIVESLRSLDLAARQRDAQLEMVLDPTVSAAIDPVTLDRIVVNLVENALRYGPTGQTVEVRLTTGERGMVRLEVGDQGPGISPTERERIFHPFVRGRANGGRGGGIGLGLAIVRHLVESAGGEVTVTDAARGGARFVVTLPGS